MIKLERLRRQNRNSMNTLSMRVKVSFTDTTEVTLIETTET